MPGKLFVTGTPIGNLQDLSPRALQCLVDCDFIAAEDTRVTLKLLNHFNIKKPLVSYYEYNKEQSGEKIIAELLSGKSCALVTDAGMPAISDPGTELVDACHKNGIEVCSVPGPSALCAAISVSGMHCCRFSFEGFLSVNRQSRQRHLRQLENEERTMIFYEAPHKLRATLSDLLDALGNRKICIVREITKLHEEIIRSTLAEALQRFSDTQPRGEFVLIVEGKQKDEKKCSLADAVCAAKKAMLDGRHANDAAREAAALTGLKKSDIYKALMQEKEKE